MPNRRLGEPVSDEFQQLLLGTWTALALIADALVRAGAAQRAELTGPLADAAALAPDHRRSALHAVRWLIETLDGPNPPTRRRPIRIHR